MAKYTKQNKIWHPVTFCSSFLNFDGSSFPNYLELRNIIYLIGKPWYVAIEIQEDLRVWLHYKIATAT